MWLFLICFTHVQFAIYLYRSVLHYLCFNCGISEGEEEPLAVVRPEAVDAPGIYGPAQVVIHLFFCVPILLIPARTNTQPETEDQRF